MTHKKLYLALLLLFVSLLLAPVAQAQSSDVDFQQILRSLGPRTEGYDSAYILLDILLYSVFFLSMVNMFVIPDKQLSVSLLNFAVILLTVFSKVGIASAFGSPGVVHPNAIMSMCALPVLAINASIFVLPLIIAGMSRRVSKFAGTPPSMFLGGLTGLIGGAHFFLAWFTIISDCPTIGGTGV